MILCGARSKIVNDIEILKEMLSCKIRVPLNHEAGKPPSVKLKDKQSKGTVRIKGLPYDSIVIRAEDFEPPCTVFKGSKGERRRADFVIVSNDERGKWIICIEIEDSNYKGGAEIIEQLKGALCFVKLLQMYCEKNSGWKKDFLMVMSTDLSAWQILTSKSEERAPTLLTCSPKENCTTPLTLF